MNWLNTGSTSKSFDECNRFVHAELLTFDARQETAKIDAELARLQDSWKEAAVVIEVPDGKQHGSSDDPPIPTFSVPGLMHRSIVETVRSVWSSPTSSSFHYTPFEQFWQRPDGITERVHDELYASEAFNEEHIALQSGAPEPGCSLERVICGLMFYSDSTHLANFGDASLWHIYMFFGNQSKYERCRPSSDSCHHIAYIPKLPDTFHDEYVRLTGRAPPADVLTHCRRELMHAVWLLLLNDEFRQAYKHGIIIRCPDGIVRRVYLRIFTYSADYPEKVLLATIRNFGSCPCPTCKIPKDKLPEVGMKQDDTRRMRDARHDNLQFRNRTEIARNAVYNGGKTIKSTIVESILSDESLVPTKIFNQNAFSDKLSEFGFDFFTMFAVDLMHEFELGVWKAIFTHLLRMLVCLGSNAIQELNKRYHAMPTFCNSTIRHFHNNASAMKKLAARDYEDLLQCALAVFEGLFPNAVHDKAIQELLFTLAEWHATAKLHMHTDSSVAYMQKSTEALGTKLRAFEKNICPQYNTKELPREEAARRGRAKRKTGTSATQASDSASSATRTRSSGAAGAKQKLLNLKLYKVHVLGYYARQIVRFGSTDSYSTQTGELQHRRVKQFYARTNKRFAARQMARMQRRAERMKNSTLATKKELKTKKTKARGTSSNVEICVVSPFNHHYVSNSRSNRVILGSWLTTHSEDPAVNLSSYARNNLLGRIRQPDTADEGIVFSQQEQTNIHIPADRIYTHATFRVNYTTYDVRRAQDTVNAKRHSDVLVPASDLDPDTGESLSGHPFAYAKVLGVYHADFIYQSPGKHPLHFNLPFLFVCWYRRVTSWKAGFERRWLHRLEFIAESDPSAFAIHIIPTFCEGQTDIFLCEGPSLARPKGETLDWRYYYVNFFVDRDMYMRYRGTGVGHHMLKVDDPPADPLDVQQETEAADEPEIEPEIRPPPPTATAPTLPLIIEEEDEDEDGSDIEGSSEEGSGSEDDESSEDGSDHEGEESGGEEEANGYAPF
ncbi:hypothetical protein K474DRAFT_1687673 [Panus rudis PR-1116 ss-1]|nr:hypothetical protein K474DRAFT_1687673 [Panus rudis PR-1116 ss-1]